MARPFGRREHQPISHLDSPAFAAGDPVLGGHTVPPGHATTRFVPCLDLELAVLQSSVHALPLDVKERARQRFDVRITPSNTCISADGICLHQIDVDHKHVRYVIGKSREFLRSVEMACRGGHVITVDRCKEGVGGNNEK